MLQMEILHLYDSVENVPEKGPSNKREMQKIIPGQYPAHTK
jgi:hypothetical protein